MRANVLRRLGVVCAALALVVATAGCDGNGGTPGRSGSGADPTASGGGTGAETTYTVKSDLCAEADLTPLQAVLPVVNNLKAQGRDLNGSPVFYCDGNAAKTDQYDDIGFFGLAAYLFGSAEDASHQYESATSPTRASDVQPISGLGQKATSFLDGREIRVAVLDGSFYCVAYWVANSGELPPAQRDEVRQALVAMTKATLVKLTVA